VDSSSPQAASWDKEYAGGRYRGEPPVAFVADILAAARRAGLASGLYLDGPKAGLEIHFFGAAELGGLFADGFEPVLPPRAQVTWRQPPQAGQWTQWEGIWRRQAGSADGGAGCR